MQLDLSELEHFIVLAKSQTYVGEGRFSKSCRIGSHDVAYDNDHWSYLDSYFGGTDFMGQEVVWESSSPVWAMNYYGRILLPDQINAERAGKIIKASLSELYQEGRFLGGFRKNIENACYIDTSQGSVNGFSGTEEILVDEVAAYRLDYHGGLVKP